MHKMFRTFLAGVLSVGMVFSGITPAAAAGTGETVKGETVTVAVASEAASSRETNFNYDWKFYLGTSSSASNVNFDDSSWENVTIPHDFSISQNFTTSGEAESGFLPGGTGWYRKTFTLPAADAGKTIVINFDGVYSLATVYVNGTKIGENNYGYNNFAFDITDYVTCDGVTENVIAVKAVNQVPTSRWYSGSGIYRDVTLFVTDPVHVAYNGTAVTTPDIASGKGTVNAAVEVANDGAAAASVTVKNTVYDQNGQAVSSTVQASENISANSSATINANPTVSNPTLWSLDNPVQYTVQTEVYVNSELKDTYETQFGFRWFSFDKTKGFYLNGQAVKLNGVCMHHDQGAAGSAAYYDAMYRQIASMKDMGVNAIRITHNPGDEDFIDICNELGVLVVEELFDGWTYAKNGNSNDFSKYFNVDLESSNQILGGNSNMTWAEFVTKTVVKRDRNDASVIMWSLCNEVQEGGSSDSTYGTIANNMIGWIKSVDSTRYVTSGDNTKASSASTYVGAILKAIQDNGGVIGFNYASSSALSSLNSSWTAPLVASETSSAVNSRGQYSSQANNSAVDGKYHLTSYDTSSVGWGMTAHDSMYNTLTKDYIAGEFVWTGWDYIGEPTPWNGTNSGSVSNAGAYPNSSYFGIVDTAGFEKDTYYLYRAQWNQDSTTLHLVTAWDSDNMLTTSGKTPVVVYTNAPTVKLYRNGTQIGTATRTVNTTSAGHKYYTYTTTSNNTSVCTAVSASGSASLYATFNVTYAAGTISAKAFDESGKEITSTSGSKTVNTPGTVSKLDVVQNKTSITADGQSLVYVEVSVEDADGNLDTTATNTINFSLSGNGEIVGVDNGDQATTAKYQQSSVLTSKTSAKIAAYAGKALVIVKSTKDAGSFTVNVSSSGLTGGFATVTTTSDGSAAAEGLVSYSYVRDYSVLAGTKPVLDTTASGMMANGTSVNGTIAWETVSSTTYNTPGDYTIQGTLTIADKTISVNGKLHVIDNVIVMRNISTVVGSGSTPSLPSVVNGVKADGTVVGEFNVVWETVTADQFTNVGDIVTVHGTATVIGDTTLPVTCTVRVAEYVNTESTNVAPKASSLTQDIPEGSQSDVLSSIINGTTTFADDTSERWTNWSYRKTSATATLTFKWDTAQILSSANLYYYYDSCCAKPETVEFQYSLDGNTFVTVGATEELVQSATLGAEYSYTFDKIINPVAVRIILTQQNGTTGSNCVGLIEAEMMTFAGAINANNSADLNGISVDGNAIAGFDADTTAYTVETASAESALVSASTAAEDNAGITVLPAYNGVVRILTISEDGSAVKTYEVTLEENEAICRHENTEVRNAKAASCTEDGYTGDTYCKDCGEKLADGQVIAAEGHAYDNGVVTKAATCTSAGVKTYTCTKCGDSYTEAIAATGHAYDNGVVTKAATCKETGVRTYTCSKCGDSYTVEIPKTEHQWDAGVVTKEATETETGIKTYTCQICGETKTEVIPIAGSKPVLSIAAAKGSSSPKITLTGKVENLAVSGASITSHGIIYITSARLGAKSLLINSTGRTRVNFSNYTADGSFSYTFSAAKTSTKYVARAFAIYTDENGKSWTVYSDPIYITYSGLK